MESLSAQTRYDDTELPERQQTVHPSIENWHPLPRKPSSTETGNSDDYEAINEQDDYSSISFSCVKEELKTEAQPPDPDNKGNTAKSTFIPIQWKNCQRKNYIAAILMLVVGWFLLGIIVSQNAVMISEIKKFNIKSAQKSFDPSMVSLIIHELKSTLITELQILKEGINQRSEAININVNKQRSIQEQLSRLKEKLFRLEEKMNCTLLDLKGSSKCAPLPWEEFQGHLYYFSETEKQWEDAKRFCIAANAHLLVIHNQQEQDFVVSRISSSVWLGLSDITTEGTWRWVDGSDVTKTFWRRGEPHDIGDEDCAVLYKEKNWNDIACNIKIKFVCQKKICRW